MLKWTPIWIAAGWMLIACGGDKKAEEAAAPAAAEEKSVEAEKAEPAKADEAKADEAKADEAEKKEAAAPAEAKKEEKAPEPAAKAAEAPTNPNCDRYVGCTCGMNEAMIAYYKKMGIEMDANTKKAVAMSCDAAKKMLQTSIPDLDKSCKEALDAVAKSFDAYKAMGIAVPSSCTN